MPERLFTDLGIEPILSRLDEKEKKAFAIEDTQSTGLFAFESKGYLVIGCRFCFLATLDKKDETNSRYLARMNIESGKRGILSQPDHFLGYAVKIPDESSREYEAYQKLTARIAAFSSNPDKSKFKKSQSEPNLLYIDLGLSRDGLRDSELLVDHIQMAKDRFDIYQYRSRIPKDKPDEMEVEEIAGIFENLANVPKVAQKECPLRLAILTAKGTNIINRATTKKTTVLHVSLTFPPMDNLPLAEIVERINKTVGQRETAKATDDGINMTFLYPVEKGVLADFSKSLENLGLPQKEIEKIPSADKFNEIVASRTGKIIE